MIKRRLERVAVTLLAVAMLLSSTGIASSLAVNDGDVSVSKSAVSSAETTSTNVSQEGGAISATTISEEGGKLVSEDKGNGTVENPYRISTASDFLEMQNKINLTTNGNKNFILTNDIDLSEIKASDFTSNSVYPGSLVSVSRNLSSASKNVYFNLDGNGHKIKGLNVSLDKGENFALFGYLNSISTVKNLIVEKCVINVNTQAKYIAVLVAENDGTISSCTLNYPVLSMKTLVAAGLVAAVNNGTVNKVSVVGTQSNIGGASPSSHTISGRGTVGAIAGLNSGKITGASAINIGEFIPSGSEKTVYGGIVGSTSGMVSNSFASGNVVGGNAFDVVGGIAGKAVNGAKFVNNYVLVALQCTASGNGVVGSGATSDMLTDCYWSSAVSGRMSAVTDYAAQANDISTLRFKTVKVGHSVNVTDSELAASWGKANFDVKGNFKQSGNGISVSAAETYASVKGITADTVARLGYTTDISLPSTVGTGSLHISQYFTVPILVVSSTTSGTGSASAPLAIGNAAEFNMLKYAYGIYARLDKDISLNIVPFAFSGNLDGNGNTINTSSSVFTEIYGNLSNVDFAVKNSISSAVLGRSVGANVSNVSVTLSDGMKFNASGSVSGVMFSVVAGRSVIDNCRVIAEVNIASEVGDFGALAGAVVGNGTAVTNSGASAKISASSKTKNAAGFIGSVKAADVSIKNCYVSGKNEAGKYLFVSEFLANDTEISSVYLSGGSQAAVNFAKYGFISETQFSEWTFDNNGIAFFTGNGGTFETVLPDVKAVLSSSAKDYSLNFDSSKLSASVSVENGRLMLKVSRAAGVVTVKGSEVTVTNKKTGLHTTVVISNGLEKDGAGRYIVSGAYDLQYISENITELYSSSFVVNSDIDMSVIKSFEPIGGTLADFSGKFDGQGHTISNLKISGTSKTGLFASLNNAEVTDIIIDSARVNAKGMYSAVLAGQVTGATKLSNITVTNSKVSANGIYSGVIVGSIDSGAVNANEINVVNCTVESKANYVGTFAGHTDSAANVSDFNAEKVSLSGAEYVAGVVGLAEGSTAIKSVKVSDSGIKAVSEASGIAAARGTASVSDVEISDSAVSALSDAAFTAGGIASSFASSIDGAVVKNTKIKAGAASAVVAKTASDANLSINNAKVYGADVRAEKVNTVAAGILAVHNAGGNAVIRNCYIDSDTAVTSSAVASGVIGDITGRRSALSAENVKSFASVECLSSADAVASAGLIGKLSASSLDNVNLKNIKIFGEVIGNSAVGGLIGVVKGIGTFTQDNAVIADSVCAAQLKIDASDENAGVVIGAVENSKAVNSDNIDSIISNTVVSTYYGGIAQFGRSTGITSSKLIDMDKPNNAPIEPSVKTLTSSEKTELTLSNLPKLKGYSFDSESGWLSEAAERVTVVSSSQDKLVVKANHMADISIIGYYVLDSDNEVRVPVHFEIKSNVRIPLKGEGTSTSPYLITNAYDLETAAYYESSGKYFALANDIIFEDSDFEFGGGFYNVGNGVVTIGNAESGFKGSFTGKYNGKIHSVSGLKISGNTFGGLFGATDGAVVSDLIINGADVMGLNYAGIIVGSAKDTVIKNITVNNSSVKSNEFGSVVGIIAGNAKSVNAENIVINNSEASTTLLATSATVETAGGVAGTFSGRLSGIQLNGVTVKSGTIAGGAVGTASNVQFENVSSNGNISGEICGGLAGVLSDPVGSSVSGCFAGGSVKATKLAAGIFGEVGTNASFLAKAEKPLIADTVIAAKAQGGKSAAVIAEADKATFYDSAKTKTDIFSNVYYSSYQNDSIFGTQEINSYQNSKFTAIDLSAMKCVVDGTEKSFITLDGEKTVIGDGNIKLNAGEGTYKAFELCGRTFTLDSVKSSPNGAVIFDDSDSSIKAEGSVDGAKLVFAYTNGLETAIPVSYSSLLAGDGTKANPYTVGTADEFAVMMQNGGKADVYYLLTDDIDLSGIKSAESFAGILDGGNHVIYDFSGESLFARVSGTVKNLGVVGFDIDSNTSVSLGALSGTLDGATVENCVVIADVHASGKVQDAGIIAGRMTNGAAVENCLTSGRVTGSLLLAAGGLTGTAYNSKIDNSVSTAYVSVGGYAGGLVGEAEYTSLSNSVFGNMTESAERKSGNIAGRFASSSTAVNVLFDGRTSKDNTTAHEGAVDAMKASATKGLSAASIPGFVKTEGYAIPASLKTSESSAKFATAVEFAAMTVKYVSGLNIGTAMNYTDIKVPARVNSNSVSVDRTKGLIITLMKNKDFSSSDNRIARFANPASENTVTVSYSIIDSTNKLDGKLVGVMLKSKLTGGSNSFGFFTEIGSETRNISGISIANGGIYADLSLPVGYGVKISAVASDGKPLKVTDEGNNGSFVSVGNSEAVELIFEITEEKPDWGVRAIWSVIGK